MENSELSYSFFDPEQEKLREALCTLGNGYFATRGAALDATDNAISYPGTYLAGGYNRLKTEIGNITIENEDLVNFPNWLILRFKFDDGAWFSINDVEIISYEQKLDIFHGTLHQSIVFLDRSKRKTTLVTRRIVSMQDPHIGAVEMTICPENWQGVLHILSALDGTVKNGGVDRYKSLSNRHLDFVDAYCFKGKYAFLQVRTTQSHMHVAQSIRTTIYIDEQLCNTASIQEHIEDGYIASTYNVEVKNGQRIRIEKVMALYTSKDHAISECGLQSRDAIQRAPCFEKLIKGHVRAWKHIWRRFGIGLKLDDADEKISHTLHLHLFHLVQTVSVHSVHLDIGIPARGWHGEAYRGHVLWDELFVFPTLTLKFPELARSLLLYRYRRLVQAKSYAEQEGYKGAMYPWQSGSCGREESQKIHLNPMSGRWIADNSRLQRHVNGAIVYNIWHYFTVTHDHEFLAFYGAEVVLEVARFWASITSYNKDKGRFEILKVMGPDEFHDGYPDAAEAGINNNAYTNIVAVWVLSRALDVLESLSKERRQELEETLEITEEETAYWREISTKMYIPFHDDGIVSQFEGYGQLKEMDFEAYKKKYGDIHRMDRILEQECDSPNNYKLSKQADVLMLLYLFGPKELQMIFEQLGYVLTGHILVKTISYYLSRTTHGSTLSRIVDSWILASSDRATSWNYFCEALKSDVADIQGGTTAEGIHLGAMAGTIDLVQRGYCGIEYGQNALCFTPQLPEKLKRIHTEIHYRGHCLLLEVTHEKLLVTSRHGVQEPVQIICCNECALLHEGQSCEFVLKI